MKKIVRILLVSVLLVGVRPLQCSYLDWVTMAAWSLFAKPFSLFKATFDRSVSQGRIAFPITPEHVAHYVQDLQPYIPVEQKTVVTQFGNSCFYHALKNAILLLYKNSDQLHGSSLVDVLMGQHGVWSRISIERRKQKFFAEIIKRKVQESFKTCMYKGGVIPSEMQMVIDMVAARKALECGSSGQITITVDDIKQCIDHLNSQSERSLLNAQVVMDCYAGAAGIIVASTSDELAQQAYAFGIKMPDVSGNMVDTSEAEMIMEYELGPNGVLCQAQAKPLICFVPDVSYLDLEDCDAFCPIRRYLDEFIKNGKDIGFVLGTMASDTGNDGHYYAASLMHTPQGPRLVVADSWGNQDRLDACEVVKLKKFIDRRLHVEAKQYKKQLSTLICALESTVEEDKIPEIEIALCSLVDQLCSVGMPTEKITILLNDAAKARDKKRDLKRQIDATIPLLSPVGNNLVDSSKRAALSHDEASGIVTSLVADYARLGGDVSMYSNYMPKQQ